VHFVEDVAWYLRRGDRLGLEASLEYCAPFLDQRLVALSLNLPWHYQTHHARDKWALRKVASHDLPRKVAFRKKIAWDLPLKAYLMPFASADFLRDGICAELFGIGNDGIERLVRVLPDDPQSLFTFVNLEIWGRLFLRGQSVDQISESIEGLHTSGART
jgi:asparagine synthase (glutamine-hydrolysing)